MKIGQRIRRARRYAEMSQIQLSAGIGVQRSAVSNWESANDIYPTMANLVAIALACNVSLEWLGTGRGSPSLNNQDHPLIPATDAELVDLPHERELLAIFRHLTQRSQHLVVELVGALHRSKKGKKP